MDNSKSSSEAPDMDSSMIQKNCPGFDSDKLDSSLESLTNLRDSTFDDIINKDTIVKNTDSIDDLALKDNKPEYHSDRTSDISRDESDGDTQKTPPRLSSVLVQPYELRSNHEHEDDRKHREAILNIQRDDKQILDRNKRMFGMLMGTLKRFKTEESDRERTTVKKTKVEEKVCLAVEEANANNQASETIEPRGRRLECVDNRSDIVNSFQNWERSNKHLCNFIQTDTKPKLLWLPKEHNSVTSQKLKLTKDYFSLCVAERTAKYKKDIEELDGKEPRIELSQSMQN